MGGFAFRLERQDGTPGLLRRVLLLMQRPRPAGPSLSTAHLASSSRQVT
jgi:hypothetical protein